MRKKKENNRTLYINITVYNYSLFCIINTASY